MSIYLTIFYLCIIINVKQFINKILFNEEDRKQFRLLKLDEMDKAYLPYFPEGFHWTNDEKSYIKSKIEKSYVDIFPDEIKKLLNLYRQSSHK